MKDRFMDIRINTHSAQTKVRISYPRHISVKRSPIILFVITVSMIFILAGGILVHANTIGTESISKYYTSIMIEQGQSLYDIASEHITDGYDSIDQYIEEISFINRIEDTNEIHAGQYICIPYYK